MPTPADDPVGKLAGQLDLVQSAGNADPMPAAELTQALQLEVGGFRIETGDRLVR